MFFSSGRAVCNVWAYILGVTVPCIEKPSEQLSVDILVFWLNRKRHLQFSLSLSKRIGSVLGLINIEFWPNELQNGYKIMKDMKDAKLSRSKSSNNPETKRVRGGKK